MQFLCKKLIISSFREKFLSSFGIFLGEILDFGSFLFAVIFFSGLEWRRGVVCITRLDAGYTFYSQEKNIRI